MPHLPDHRNHDPLVIAAYAAGDADGADLEQARDLVAACDDCAALHHDLRAISAALPATPAPVRPRDFRLTPEQAAQLRPAGWRRFLAPLAGPRFAFAAPLGGSLAALGIAGILIAGAASTPIANVTGTGPNAERERAAASAGAQQEPGDATAIEIEGAASSSAPSAPVDQPAYVAQPSEMAPAPQAGGGTSSEDAKASQPPVDTSVDTNVDNAVSAPGPTDEVRTTADGGNTADEPPAGAEITSTTDSSVTTTLLASPLATLAFVVLAAGLVLLGARIVARRSV